MLRNLCVFCGSNAGIRPVYTDAARELGELLAQRNIGLVYGGSKVGLMGVLADACLNAGGRVTGVMPQVLVDKEVAHLGLTTLHVVETMHERKALMADLSDAFLALPGAYGTWDEFCEVLTWSQVGLHRKACALLNVNGYYNCLLSMADQAVKEGFLRGVHRELLLDGTDAGSLIERLATYAPPMMDKWIGRAER